MSWITPQDYNEAIQTPAVSFADPVLQSGRPLLNAVGLPHCATGTFASVYRLRTKEGDFAVRCPLFLRDDMDKRYAAIRDFLSNRELECMVPFEYLERGILVRGNWQSVIKMRWQEGETLDEYLNKYYQNSERVRKLTTQFSRLARDLKNAGIAHGDLQHGNILVSKDGLMLVDYDPIFVPALSGLTSLEIGHPNYQHPGRNAIQYDTTMDNFSCWLIHTSLLMLSIDCRLYERFLGGDDCILFKRSDLACPASSALFETLLSHESSEIRRHAELLARMLCVPPESIPELSAREEELAHLFMVPALEMLPPESCEQAYLLKNLQARTEKELMFGNEFNFALKESQDCTQERFSRFSMTFKRIAKKTGRVLFLSKKAASRVSRFISPGLWAKAKIARADRSFWLADYEVALDLYREVYQCLESKTSCWSAHAPMIYEALIGAGYCCGLLRNYSHAHNFFLAAHIYPSTWINSDPNRTSLLLAINHCMNNETAAAKKALSLPGLLLDKLPDLIDSELVVGFIKQPEFFLFLVELIAEQRRLERGLGRPLLNIGSACMRIYDSLQPEHSSSVCREAIELLAIMAEQSIGFEQQTELLGDIIDRIVGIARKISNRETESQSSCPIAESFQEVLSKAGIDISLLEQSTGSDVGKVLYWCQLELSVQHLEKTNQPRALLEELNSFDTNIGSRFLSDRLGHRSAVSSIELLLAANPVSDLTQVDSSSNNSLHQILISRIVKNGTACDTGRMIAHFVLQGYFEQLTEACNLMITKECSSLGEPSGGDEAFISPQFGKSDVNSEWISEVIQGIVSSCEIETFLGIALDQIDTKSARFLWSKLRAESVQIDLFSLVQILDGKHKGDERQQQG
ncbi:MAG: hypothetical protein K2Z81_21600, partial [Cyanobacteria bacterium]|nr:hypothetical protein [Cyanobacteriota bacterium]